jgi:uncharacterized protein YbaP (TraB family)
MLRNAFQAFVALSFALPLLFSACKSDKKPTETPGESATVASDTASDTASDETAKKATDEAPKKAEETTKHLADPFFYKIQGPDGASGHILGSMHMGVDAETELPPRVWAAMTAATVLVIEADIRDASMSSGMMLPKGESLRDMLGEKHWKLVEEKLGSGMAKMMVGMKPAAVAATIGMKGLPITMPMELALILKADEAKIKVDYLETAAFQLDLLTKIMDTDFLKHMLETSKPEDSTKLLDIYRGGDEEALLAAILTPDAWGQDFDSNIEAMLYKRNDDWIPKLEKLFAQKGAFVAVGAAHLVGPRGVLASLKKLGYTVERVSK